jgi:hypothetical protein
MEEERAKEVRKPSRFVSVSRRLVGTLMPSASTYQTSVIMHYTHSLF